MVFGRFNLDYALRFEARVQTVRKSVTLEVEPQLRYGESEKWSVATDFEAV